MQSLAERHCHCSGRPRRRSGAVILMDRIPLIDQRVIVGGLPVDSMKHRL
jgi:hypothetical protein